MARYTYLVRGSSADSKDEIVIQEKPIDLNKGEQLTEHYLCDINRAGEVPVLAFVDSEVTISDSLEITKFFAQTYPTLIPDSHADQIVGLLGELHSINFFSLTFTGSPQAVEGRKGSLVKQLDDPNLSEKYREAIHYKIQRYDKNKLGGLAPGVPEKMADQAKMLMLKIEGCLDEPSSPWLFGLDHPSALDAHVIVFVARMYDVKRHELIPEKLKVYASRAFAKEEWKNLMQGRNTTGF